LTWYDADPARLGVNFCRVSAGWSELLPGQRWVG
jgi:hypothetical protein